MEIIVKKRKKVKVNLSEKQQRKITLEYLKKHYDQTELMFIKDDSLMHEVEYVTSHKWYSDEVYRKLNKIDSAVLKVIKDLTE